MGNMIKTGVVSLLFATSPLSVNANSFESNLKNQTNTELSNVLDRYVSPQIVTDAVLSYFDEEVRYKLSSETREKLVSILNSYLLSHPILIRGNEGKMSLVIDDKKEFVRVVKQIVNLIIGDMPLFIRKIGIPLVFGGNDRLQEKLDNLGKTVMNMKEKQYKDVVFDYVGGIVKRVAKSVNGNMTVKEYYDNVSRYFPNKNSINISQELIDTGNGNGDIKYMKYPFK